MKTARQQTGRRGEDAACEYLRSLGHTVLTRNWRYSHLEIDIISADPAGVHFVEVKARTAPVMAPPEFNVGPDKQRRLVRAAQAFIHSASLPSEFGDEIFFDVVSVVFDAPRPNAAHPDAPHHAGAGASPSAGTGCTLEYFPQAWIPTYFGR